MKPTRSFWKKLRILLLICLVLFIALQFIRPPLDNPPVVADLNAPPEVKAILRRACYDCHSNETHLAWFDQPAPAFTAPSSADNTKMCQTCMRFVSVSQARTKASTIMVACAAMMRR